MLCANFELLWITTAVCQLLSYSINILTFDITSGPKYALR